MDQRLKKAISEIRAGNETEAYRLLVAVIDDRPVGKDLEVAWLWMSEVVDGPVKKRRCLENVLTLNPDNDAAKRGLAYLETSSLSDESKARIERSPAEVSEVYQPTVLARSISERKIPFACGGVAIMVFVCFILVIIAPGIFKKPNADRENKPSIDNDPGLVVPPTYTPVLKGQSGSSGSSDYNERASSCGTEVDVYLDRISPIIYSFAKVGELAYEVTVDVAMIPILIELDDLKDQYRRISVPSCVSRPADRIASGMDDIIEALTDFTIGVTEADATTRAVHNGLRKMLDGLDQMIAI